jgi:hypothetical protein
MVKSWEQHFRRTKVIQGTYFNRGVFSDESPRGKEKKINSATNLQRRRDNLYEQVKS